MKLRKAFLLSSFSATLIACGSGDSTDDTPENTQSQTLEIPTTYTFNSTLSEADDDSVSYTGQTKRHLLINDLTSAIKQLEENANQDVIADLNFYFRFNGSASDSVDHGYHIDNGLSVIPGPSYGDISLGKNLVDKIAGNDKPAHLIDGKFFGWQQGLDINPTPEKLVDYFFSQIASMTTDGPPRQIAINGGATADIDAVYLTNTGQDFSQLTQKFLLGAVTFSQGTADYLKTDFSQGNDTPETEGKAYTTAQHKWDEAFGYFGAARNYSTYTDDEIAAKGGRAEFANGYYDTNNDGQIDLRSEINLGHASNCAKRDRGAVVATDFTQQAFNAFLTGRAILNATSSNLTSEPLSQLQAAALTASQVWEKCIAATVIHYINDVIGDMEKFTDDKAYDDLTAYKNHAKHWSEMKGFALSLQFNPDSPFRHNSTTLTNLKTLLSLMGDAPVLADDSQHGAAFSGGVSQYRTDLLQARDMIGEAYAFARENVNGW